MGLIGGLIARLTGRYKGRLTSHARSVFRELRAGDVAIDAGANIGVVTAAMVKRGAVVHAFEPNADAFAVLSRRFERNENVTLHRKAVHVSDESIKLFRHQRADENPVKWSNGSSMIVEKGNVNPDDFITVDAVDLAAYVMSLDQPVKLMKMDIEGAEVAVVNHLIDTGAIERIEQLFVETHERQIPALAEATAALRRRIEDLQLSKVSLDWM